MFSHSSANYPGDHSKNLACIDCHTSNAQTVPWPNGALAPDCAACHTNNFKASEHKKTSSPTTIFYTAAELKDCAGACHEYTDNTFTTIRRSRTGEHRVNKSSF
jgi:predicted CxxxxCH...CXXCH cytochrome family protein